LFLVAALGVRIFAIAPVALAGKGGGKGAGGAGGNSAGSTTVTVTPGGPYTFGEPVWVTTNAPILPNNAGPWIELMCYSNGTLVGSGDHAGFSGGMGYNDPFYLGPTQSWSGGAADCTVTVFHQDSHKFVTDASTTFHVNG